MYSFTCCSSKLEAHTHNKAKEPKHRPKNADTHKHTHTKTKNMQGGKYNTFCVKMSGEWGKENKTNPHQGGLVSAWNAFLLNVFTSMGYLSWWGKLFHNKEPEKEKLVLKISILVLGKSCLFPWTWRRSEGIMRSFRYCGALPWTTFCTLILLSNSFLSKGSSTTLLFVVYIRNWHR